MDVVRYWRDSRQNSSSEKNERTSNLIDVALKKLNDCEEQRHETEEQAAFIGGFTAAFKSFQGSFNVQATSCAEEIYERPGSGNDPNRHRQPEAQYLKSYSPALCVGK